MRFKRLYFVEKEAVEEINLGVTFGARVPADWSWSSS